MMMRRVGSVAEALSSLSIERHFGSIQTNFYPSRDVLLDWIRDDSLYILGGKSASLLLRRDRDFFHLLLSFANPAEAGDLLDSLPADEIFVADIVSRGERSCAIVDLLASHGYSTHRQLRRLRRPPTPNSMDSESIPLIASGHDSDWVFSMLESHFDRFSEQLPNAREICRATSNGAITLIRINGSNVAFLYHESIGMTSTLRYWFVVPDRRDSRIGGQLLRHYLSAECTNRSSQLWVVEDNENAIKRYYHYGFKSDGLTNHVMMRGAGRHG